MASYYNHTAILSRKVPYSFQCEHCMENSGSLTATIYGPEGEYRSSKKNLTEKQTEVLNERAHNNLLNQIVYDHKYATEKQIFSTDFKDECPHCHKPQSWGLAGLKDQFAMPSIITMGLGIFVSLAVYFLSGTKNAQPSLYVFGAFTLVAAVLFIYNYIKIVVKTKKAAGGLHKNLPTIDWSAVEDLMAEHREGLAKKMNK